jgi:hypothetical protein
MLAGTASFGPRRSLVHHRRLARVVDGLHAPSLLPLVACWCLAESRGRARSGVVRWPPLRCRSDRRPRRGAQGQRAVVGSCGDTRIAAETSSRARRPRSEHVAGARIAQVPATECVEVGSLPDEGETRRHWAGRYAGEARREAAVPIVHSLLLRCGLGADSIVVLSDTRARRIRIH